MLPKKLKTGKKGGGRKQAKARVERRKREAPRRKRTQAAPFEEHQGAESTYLTKA